MATAGGLVIKGTKRMKAPPAHSSGESDAQRQQQQLERQRRQQLRDCRLDCISLMLLVGVLVGLAFGIVLLTAGTIDPEVGACTIEGPVQCQYDAPAGKPPTSRGYLPHAHIRFGADRCKFTGFNDRVSGRKISQEECEAWASAHSVGSTFECQRWEGECADSWHSLSSGKFVAGIFVTIFTCGFLCMVSCAWWYDYSRRFPRTQLCCGGENCLHRCSCGLLRYQHVSPSELTRQAQA